jgi:hypothetical protein
MAELWIIWRDETGAGGRVRVDRSPFTIGRHPECDLAIPNNKLSREHAAIERSGDIYILADRGSSNGIELNSRPLIVPEEIFDGDRANLGGGAALAFQFADETTDYNEPASVPAEVQAAAVTVDAPPSLVAASPSVTRSESGGFPTWLLIAGPAAMLIIVVVAIGLLLLLNRGDRTEISNLSIRNRSTPDDGPTKERTPTGTPASSPSGSPTSSNENTVVPTRTNLGENAKVEQNAASFLRRIAQNDPKAFVTADQAQKVAARAKQVANATLAANIESARKNAAGLKSLASQKNLTPQFLATAAMAKLGGTRGDVLQTAQSMAPILEKLQTQIGCELYDDCLMMIAAYDQGEKGDFMRLRNALQDLATKFPESSRSIRSIWFLQKQSKITDAEFEFALRFLAIGTISQNPKDFGVSAEPLTF